MGCLGIKGNGARIGVFAWILLSLLGFVCYILSYIHFHSACPGNEVLDLLVVACLV
jgi:DMSO/TMAO reductase YedYZ heme-binding membrane subunit